MQTYTMENKKIFNLIFYMPIFFLGKNFNLNWLFSIQLFGRVFRLQSDCFLEGVASSFGGFNCYLRFTRESQERTICYILHTLKNQKDSYFFIQFLPLPSCYCLWARSFLVLQRVLWEIDKGASSHKIIPKFCFQINKYRWRLQQQIKGVNNRPG